MANLSSLTPFTTAATGLSNLILVSPQATIGYQPQSPSGNDGQTQQQPPAFVFGNEGGYEGEQIVKLESDITDHYVEDNTAIQDQWSLKPEIVKTDGFIAELNDIAPSFLAPVQAIADKLTVISAYTPGLSVTALLAYTTAFQLYQIGINAADSAVAAWSSLNGSGGESVIGGNGFETLQPNQSKQQTAFQTFYGYWRNRTLFTVQTPWAVFINMALMNVEAIQDAETRVISNFKLTFKTIRTAQAYQISAVTQGRLSAQASVLNNIGTTQPVQSIGLSTGLGASYPSLFGN